VPGGILCFAHNYLSLQYMYARSAAAVPIGHHFLSMEFEPTGEPDRKHGKGTPGLVKLLVDGEEVGRAHFPVTTPNRLGQGAAMQVGVDGGGSVTPEYKAPFRFTGEIVRVIIDVSGEHVVDHEAEIRVILAKQ
jgi:arylsulfatase